MNTFIRTAGCLVISLWCAVAAAQSSGSPTRAGAPSTDAETATIEAGIKLPDTCFGPIVLVRAAGFNGNLLPQPGPWIAGTGFTSSSEHDGKDDKDSK